MPTSEKIVSPGVFTNEIDKTFLPAAIGDIGAAIIGPTVKGPAMIPTVVSSMAEFEQIFGEVLLSGSTKTTYLTSETARQYLKHGNKLTVIRILDGSYIGATANIPTGSGNDFTGSAEPQTISASTAADGGVSSRYYGFLGGTIGGPEIESHPGTDYSFKLHTLNQGEVFNNVNLEATASRLGIIQVQTSSNIDASGGLSASINVPKSVGGTGTPVKISFRTEMSGSAIADTILIQGTGSATTKLTDNILNAINGVPDYDSDNAVITALFGTGSTATGSSDEMGKRGIMGLSASISTNASSASLINLFAETASAFGNDIVFENVSGSLFGFAEATASTADHEDLPAWPHTTTLGSSSMVGGRSITSTDGLLVSGSSDNIRWEVANSNPKKGTFNLLIRRGDDTNRQKQILETWNNVSMDEDAPNYIAKIIGDQKPVLTNPGTDDAYIAYSGSFINKSKYVRVEVVKPISKYLDENGNTTTASMQSMPGNGSGSFGGAFTSGSSGWVGFDSFGTTQGTAGAAATCSFHENISNTNSQGYKLETTNQGKTAYEDAISLLANQDEYDMNLLFLPGVIDNFSNHQAIVTKAVNMIEDRADAFLVIDPSGYGEAPSAATSRADARNSSYASMYYPWLKIGSPSLGESIWVPPSVGVSGVYSFNDKISHPWFAPAGLNRGVIDAASTTERQITRSQRDTLYNSNVNPIPQFPGQGVVVWGQKTLQKKPSALDRVNVRRLLIKLRKFIASTSRFLVFEQNNTKTRNRFLNIVNPYMEQVQSNSGLNAFKIVMDQTNNTADIVDRNILYGQIFVQPTRTAEFIVLDFTLQPSGATFPE